MTDTINKPLSNTWSKIADDGEDFCLSVHETCPVAIAFMESDTDPTSDGHIMRPRETNAQGTDRINNTPPGYAFARTTEPGHTTTIGLTVWSSS